MGFLQNDWVRYYDRTYQQIKAQVLTAMQFRVPEITDHTESNPFVKALSIWSAIAEMVGYYLDNQGREAHLDSCRLYSSGISHARKADYRVVGKLANVVPVEFVISAVRLVDTVIPAGTVVKSNATGVQYTTLTNLTIPAGQLTVSGNAQQYVSVTGLSLPLTSGVADNEIIVGTDVMDSSTSITINSVVWNRQDTLAFSLPTDNDYIETVDANYNQVIIFGDGINGAIPASGQVPICSYKSTLGDKGVTEVGDIDTVVGFTVVGVTLSVTNTAIGVGGSDVESLDSIKSRVPKMNRTKNRAVTGSDYIDIAELCPGVDKASYIFGCGKTVDVYIVGIGGGLANDVLLAACSTWFDDRKMITTKVNVLPAGEIRIKLVIAVKALASYNNSDVANTVLANLAAFGNYKNQKIRGQIQLGDIYQTVENSTGVDYSLTTGMTPISYARPLDSNTAQLNWTRVIQPASTTPIQWSIIFIGPTTFEVLKNNGYLGQFETGTTITQPEIVFTVAPDTYTSGQSWQFYTYPYFGSIVLQEPSIPAIYADDIELTVTGGL